MPSSINSRSFEAWRPHLEELCERVRAAVAARGAPSGVAPPVRRGLGDVSFAPDVVAEEAVDAWLAEVAAREPLSLLTEDAGWRHAGPDAGGGARALPGFDHGGPRLVLDPIDGTRNLMADLRPAWTAVAFADPGADEPRLADVRGGVLGELPVANAAGFRRLTGDLDAGRATLAVVDLVAGSPEEDPGCPSDRTVRATRARAPRPLRADGDDRVDHGYFPFFRYLPAQRPRLAAVEAEFFARLARDEGADVRSCYDDQYISNAGQLALLALGTYRFVADLRAHLAAGEGAVTSKPYDVAAAIACARAAGCEVVAPDGGPLDFPLDASTPISFVGYANPATRARLAPCLRAALAAAPPWPSG